MQKSLPSAGTLIVLFLLTGLLPVLTLSVKAQTFNGNASDLGNGCLELTPDVAWNTGSVFFPDTLNLNQPFTFLMDFYFGTKDANGADGIVFVLQNNDPNQLGVAGGSLGFFGIPNSLGIEFDTYENIPESDPVADHISIMRDGNISHTTPQNLAGPVSATSTNANIEDGQDHLVQINWDPAILQLEVYFDCELRLTYTADLVNTIFSGDSLVYWGFTGASGGAFNGHRVCFVQLPLGVQNSLSICQGDTTTLMAPPSIDGVYTWSPAYNLSSSTLPVVQAWPGQDTTYTLTYTDPCGLLTIDTFVVDLDLLPGLELGNDTTLCEGTTLLLDPFIAQGYVAWSDGSSADTLLVDTAGLYNITVEVPGGCITRDSINIDMIELPVVTTNPDTTLCGQGLSYLLTVTPELPNTDYVWSTGDTTPELTVSQTDLYVVEAINACGTATDTADITFFRWEDGYFIPNVFTPNGDAINDTYKVENFRPEEFYLQIFDRWGRKVFDTTDREATWDGYQNGQQAAPGIYFYLIRTRDCVGEVVEAQGSLSLLR